MPGGKIAVTGLIYKLNITDDELAAVMGHEIAACLTRAWAREGRTGDGIGIAAAIGGAVGASYGIDANVGQTVLGTVGELAFMRLNSRGMEQEAGSHGRRTGGARRLRSSCGDLLVGKMGRVPAKPPQWLSTHRPSNQSRIADLKGVR